MSEKSDTLGRKVWAGVAVGVILGFLTWLFSGISRGAVWRLFTAFVAWCWSITKACWTGLFEPVGVPKWILGFLILCATSVVGARLAKWRTRKTKDDSSVTTLDYTEDQFDKVLWRWDYNFGQITNIVPFCPVHDRQLVYSVDRGYGFATTVHLSCEQCGADKCVLPGQSMADVSGRIARHIDANLRTGEWKNGITRMKLRALI